MPEQPVQPNQAAGRPHMPEDYGVPKSGEGVLEWRFVDERMREALNYWIVTVRPDGRPHAMPVWGVWLDGRLYMDGSPDTVRNRNIMKNPNVVVHLEDGTKVVIIEGQASAAGKPDSDLAQRLSREYTRKYAWDGYSPEPGAWDNGGLYIIRPKKVFAWTDFPKDTTRWRLD